VYACAFLVAVCTRDIFYGQFLDRVVISLLKLNALHYNGYFVAFYWRFCTLWIWWLRAFDPNLKASGSISDQPQVFRIVLKSLCNRKPKVIGV